MHRCIRGYKRLASLAGTVLAISVALPPVMSAASDPTASLSLSKEVFEPGTTTPLTGPVKPGQEFDYDITAACSGLTEGCVGAKTVDVIPAGVTIEVPPSQPPLYTVAYDSATRTLTVTYTSSLPAPPGTRGLPAGSSRDLTIRATVDQNVTDGQVITNMAQVTADNANPAQGSASVTATVPAVVRPVATKAMSPSSVVALSHAGVTITLGAANNSSSTAKVTSLTVGDSSRNTWDDFDLTGIGPVMEFPAGADQVAVAVCTQAAPCTPDQLITGPPQPGPSLVLPAGVDPATVTGVSFVFSDHAGAPLSNSGSAGSVQLQVRLRDTVRSTGAPLDPTRTLTQQNCASPSAVDASGATTTGPDACIPFTIVPGTPNIGGSKQFFADATGSFTSNGYAVAGQRSGVSALAKVVNKSQFPVTSMTITEPSASTPSTLTDINAQSMRLIFPAGATNADGSFTCGDGSTVPFSYTAPPTTVNVTSTGCPSGAPPSKVTVTFTGSIAPDATGTLGIHGVLSDSVAGGTTLSNCADGQIESASVRACANLAVENPSTEVAGTKTGAGSSTGGALVQGQPFTFTAEATNSGNLPQNEFVLTDPAPGAGGQNPFDVVRLTSAKITTKPAALASRFALEVFANGSWQPYNAGNPTLLSSATGVRARLTSGTVAPTNNVVLTVTVTPRDGVAPGTTITNCQSTSVTSVAGTGSSGSVCAATQTVATPATAGQIAKDIVPASVARPIAGVPPQTAQVRLRAANTGNVPMNAIIITDPDQTQQNPNAFFDSVNLVSIDGVNFPPGANRVQVDACVSFADCAAGNYVQGTPAATAALPSGVAPGSVTGLRFTFTSASARPGDYLLNPGQNYPSGGSCPNATVCFTVAPRLGLRSDPGTAIPDHFTNIAAAAGGSVLSGGQPGPIGTAPADLTVTPGTLRLGTAKSAAPTQVSPGTPILYSLAVTNTGTGIVPSLLVTEPLPPGLVFDPTFNGDNGQPFTVTADVPPGTPQPPAPAFTPVADPATHKITSLAWQFPASYAFLPGSRITISFQANLAPGTAAGTVVPNTFGATTSDPAEQPKLTCQQGTPQPDLGCTAGARVTTRSGNAIDAQKWVHGDDALGFFNTRTGQSVPAGDPSCPLLMAGGQDYTRFPCIARILAGQRFDFLLNFTNVGTTPAVQTRVVDDLPKLGDRGVIVPGDRGTEWDPRPAMAGPPSLTPGAPGTLTVSYASVSPGCILDLAMPPGTCPAGAWNDTFAADDEAFRAFIDFTPALAPGQSTQLQLPMLAPASLSGTGDGPIAWNSFAHSDFFQVGSSTVQLPAVEPIKVGIAMPFGSLAITKKVTGGLPPGSVFGPFTITYSCVVTTAAGQAVTVASGQGDLAADQTMNVAHIPVGAVCTIGETNPDGARVTLPGPVTITAADTADVTNDFSPPVLIVTKRVAGPGAAHAPASFTAEISCTLAGNAVPGYPRALRLAANRSMALTDIPAGADCTARETGSGGAASTTIQYSDGTEASIRTDRAATIVITNTFAAVPPPPPTPSPSPSPSPSPGRPESVGQLPVTGADLPFLIQAALALLAAGLLLRRAARRRLALPVEVYRRQVLDVLLGDLELYAVGGAGHRADRDGYLLAAPQVAFLEEHMGDVVAAGVDDQALDLADVTVSGMHVLAAAYGYLSHRNGVVGDRLRSGLQVHFHAYAAEAVVGPGQHLLRAVGRVAGGSRHELGLLSGIELLELGEGAAEPDLLRGRVHEAERDEPAEALPVGGLDYQMRELLRDGVEHHPDHRAAGPVGAGCLGADRELRCLWHGHPPRVTRSLVTLHPGFRGPGLAVASVHSGGADISG
jgi:uncharacterized repeat protein (TIGR01451 family)